MSYGCHNNDNRQAGYFAQDGWIYAESTDVTTRMARMVFVLDVMSTGCQYSQSTKDQRCEGCKWKP
ncbi:hypothetical protein [Cupriavidus basilensis]|uniref:Uncharacterized protein n=1 Tax=Cupriavidus basilensis TaxID=68895 RepID=A0A0C4Y979_9BURK|nr:hypothetical protein [Cupriavidus basilensis]AJG18774.1 hypothetical protein RR42_m1372 [Cupriavidus basilensis]